jgi:hypothetical protein
MITRRSFITGLASLLAVPAIVRATSLMPVKTPLYVRLYPEMDLSIERITVTAKSRCLTATFAFEPLDYVPVYVPEWITTPSGLIIPDNSGCPSSL